LVQKAKLWKELDSDEKVNSTYIFSFIDRTG